MSTTDRSTDCSKNRFNTLDDSKSENPFLSKNKSNDNSTFKKTTFVSSRWSNLSSMDADDDSRNRSPKNTFRRKKSNFGPNKDKYGNYRKPTFRRTRPKTPPPTTFDYKEDDFPTLG